VKLWHEHDIPFRWSEEFFDAMFQDTQVDHYASYEDLQKYMYGSAQVVGLMMCKILRIPPEAYPYACALGEAMQLTNFLRDVREDRCEYKRMYMPRDLLHYYEIDE
jgi:phytoene synthase